ncbi:cation:proton antiporter family protein [Rothia nasimurium]|uniref:cation:proton antiporter family protein n=1 Tax=Rothia nasimurium TaxID=85336 RepID=UPI001F2A71A1|nr:cation:proton antiporter family protein [Rothia nasimurium]
MSEFIPYLLVPVLFGLLAKMIKLPPLLGFLAAGIALNFAGYEELGIITELGDLGVTLLLFTIGLKLDVRLLLRREVWLTSSIHMLITTLCGASLILFLVALGLGATGTLDLSQAAILGFALSFSSTVLVVKTLDERSDSRSLYGRTAIGILVIQDLFAVLFVAATGEHAPSPWAVLLLLLIPAAWLFKKGLTRVGHGELLVLYGVVMAFVPGYWLFDFFHVKGDLGALVMGMLLASHPKSNELSHTLLSLKEFMLIGFFLSIGLSATPTLDQALFGFILLLLIPINTAAYALILRLTGLTPRTTILTALTLSNFSEFAIILVAMTSATGLVDESWMVTFSLAVSFSFVLSTLLNMRGSKLPQRLASRIPDVPEHKMHPEERPVDFGDAQAIIIGMGRLGTAAYTTLTERYGLKVIGMDSSEPRVDTLTSKGYRVLEADATDPAFWRRVTAAEKVELVLLAMPAHGTNVDAMQQVIEAGSEAVIGVVAQHVDELQELDKLGADSVVNLYSGAGETLADNGFEAMQRRFYPQAGTAPAPNPRTGSIPQVTQG